MTRAENEGREPTCTGFGPEEAEMPRGPGEMPLSPPGLLEPQKSGIAGRTLEEQENMDEMERRLSGYLLEHALSLARAEANVPSSDGKFETKVLRAMRAYRLLKEDEGLVTLHGLKFMQKFVTHCLTHYGEDVAEPMRVAVRDFLDYVKAEATGEEVGRW